MTLIRENQSHQCYLWLKKSTSNQNHMLGEGMPWHIILVFFVIGIFAGINGGKKDKKKKEETTQQTIEV
jgi:hypothetical protein